MGWKISEISEKYQQANWWSQNSKDITLVSNFPFVVWSPYSDNLCYYCALKFNLDFQRNQWTSINFTFRKEWERNYSLLSDCFLLGTSIQFSSVQLLSCVSLRPHEPQHTRPPCPSPTPGVHPNPCPLSRWCHPTISSSVIPFSSCPQSFPESGSFQWVSSSHQVAKVLEFQL